MVGILVDKSLPLAINKDAVGQCGRWIERNTQEALVHIDRSGTNTESHLDTAAGIVWVTNWHSTCLCQLGRVLLHHFGVHNEATRTQNNPFVCSVTALFHVLANDQTHNTLPRTVTIDNKPQCTRLDVHVDIALLYRLSDDFNEQRSAVIALDIEIVTTWRMPVLFDIGPGFLAAGVQQAVVC